MEGGVQNTEIAQNNSANFRYVRKSQKKKKNSPNTRIFEYRVRTRCHAETTSLYITFSANNTEITINNLLINVLSDNFRFDCDFLKEPKERINIFVLRSRCIV